MVTVLAELLELAERPAWHADAACRGEDVSVFFIERGEDTTRARALCAGCEVREECLEHALAQPERHGVWGGLSDQERRRVIKARRHEAAA